MQIEEVVSPTYSVSSGMLKLNSSSIASSTPGCNPQGPLVFFQQFSQNLNGQGNRMSQPKKRLTIQIDEEYDFQQNSEEDHKESFRPTIAIPTPESESESISNEKIATIIDHYERELNTWRKHCEMNESAKRELQRENQQLRLALKKKDEMLINQKEINSDLVHRMGHLEQLQAQDRFYDQKMRQKQSKFKQLQKVHDKVVVMNKSLQRELRENEKKIMELQRELQRNVCTTQQENLVKIRQTSTKLKESGLKLNTIPNKENTFANTVKSVEKKKVTGSQSQIKKTGRVSSSSTTNIAKKLQIKNSLI